MVAFYILFWRHRAPSLRGQAVSDIEITVTQSEDAPMPSASDPFPDLHPSEPLPILIRASNGKSMRDRGNRVKFYTIVKPSDLDGFYARYADICKAGMAALKPRDRSKKKAKAKKKKAGS